MYEVKWTYWDEVYEMETAREFNNDGHDEAKEVLTQHIRSNGIMFSGESHQHRNETGIAPYILKDGKLLFAFAYSMRSWGGIMAEAYSVNDEKYSYIDFAYGIHKEFKEHLPEGF